MSEAARINVAACQLAVNKISAVVGAMRPYLDDFKPNADALRSMSVMIRQELANVDALLGQPAPMALTPEGLASARAALFGTGLDDGVPLPPPVEAQAVEANPKSEARSKAWETRRRRYGEAGHRGSYNTRKPVPQEDRIDLSKVPSGMEAMAERWRGKGGKA